MCGGGFGEFLFQFGGFFLRVGIFRRKAVQSFVVDTRALQLSFQSGLRFVEVVESIRASFEVPFDGVFDFFVIVGVEKRVQNGLTGSGVGEQKFSELALRQQNNLSELIDVEAEQLFDFRRDV